MDKLPTFVSSPNPDIYREGNYVVLDFETTNIEKGSALERANRIVLACWYDSRTGLYYESWGDELEQRELIAALDRADFIVAHNAKFELQWLDRCGFDIGSKPVYDTMVAEWVLAGNRPWRVNLDACLERRGKKGKDSLVSLLIENGVCPSEIHRDWLLKYCRRDVYLTQWLMRRQLAEVRETRLLPVIYTRCLTIAPLADIETRGLMLDEDMVEREYKEHAAKYQQVLREMDELTGGINPKSSIQVANFVYKELGFPVLKKHLGKPNVFTDWPDGKPSTSDAVLLSLKPKTARQKEFLRLKKLEAQIASALDKNLSMFQGACKERGGHIYGELNQCRTATHRLASSGKSTYFKMFDKHKGCQFQNLPNKFKSIFKARRPGWLVAEADYAQLEYRAGGFLTKEPVIYREVEEGFDVHKYTASVMNDIPESEVTYELRRAAKPDTFKPVYGGTKGTPAQEKYYAAFQEKYSTMYDEQERWCEIVNEYKELETAWGMKYYWPNARTNSYGYLNVKTKVFNYPIQAFATAEIVPIGLSMFWHRIRSAQMFLVNTVHDSIECELPENEIELFTEVAVQALTHDVYRYVRDVYKLQIDIPLGLGIVIGTHWSKSSVSEERWDRVNEALDLAQYEYEYDDGEVSLTVNPSEE